MAIEILLLIAGLAMVLWGADLLVEHASRIARRWGISEFVIGATIVAIGTSAPEMVVSFIASIDGKSTIAAGNVIGSNIFNTALILGISALIAPIPITRENMRRDIPMNILATILLIVLGLKLSLTGWGSNGLGRTEGAAFLLMFAAFMWSSFRSDLQNKIQTDETAAAPDQCIGLSWLMLGVGLAMLIAGGRLFVNEACNIARNLGLSDKFIAVTILAAGTSLPELATSCVAAAKGKCGLAFGNVIGSDIANILLILGGSALIRPLDMSLILPSDYLALFLCAALILLFACTGSGRRICRWEGLLLVALEAAYMVSLIQADNC